MNGTKFCWSFSSFLIIAGENPAAMQHGEHGAGISKHRYRPSLFSIILLYCILKLI